MEHNSIKRHVLIVFSRKLFPVSFVKKGWHFNFFGTDSTFTIAQCHFQLRRFSNVSAGSIGFLLTCMGEVVIDGVEILGSRIFLPPSFWQKQLKTQFFREQVLLCCLSFFQRGSVTLLPFFGLLSPIWHPKAWKAMKHKLQLVFSRTFCFFSQDFGRKLLWKKWFFQKNSASSKVLRARYAWNWSISNELRNRLNNMHSSEFWFKCELRANFAHGWIAEKCQKLFP